MANIEESLITSMAARRRKGTSLGSVSSRSSPKLDTILSSKDNSSIISTQSKDFHHLQHNLKTQQSATTTTTREIINNK